MATIDTQAASEDNTIAGTADGDYIIGSAGNDVIDGKGNGTSGNWWQDTDQVHYAESLYMLNRNTGENVKAFNIVANDDGSVTVERLDLSNDGEVVSSDLLTNIERIIFGEGDNRIEVFLDQRTDVWMWNDDSGPRRMEKIEGSILDDDIIGDNLQSRLFGGKGNDVIHGDTDVAITASLTASGGSRESFSMPSGGSVSQLTVSLGQVISAPLVNANGGTIQNTTLADNLAVNVVVVAGTSGADATQVALKQTSLENEPSLPIFVDQVASFRDLGYEVSLWVDQQVDINDGNGVQSGAMILDIIDPYNFRSGDTLTGDAGNDYIDGGLKGNAPENTWNNNNEARYKGSFDDFELNKIAVTNGSETTFANGQTLTDWWATFGPTGSTPPATFTELLASLGLDRASVEAGEYVIVRDKTGAEGIDVVKNVQFLSFTDHHVGLEEEVRDIDWRGNGEPAGVNIKGTLFADNISSGDGYDEISSGAGNDYIDAGAGGDRVQKISGNDFIDGGLSGNAGNKWQDSDEVRFSGNLSRYDLNVVGEAEVNAYFTDHFAGDGHVYNGSNTYFLVADLSPVQSTGTTLIANVDRLSFDDQSVWLNVSDGVWGHNVGGTLDADEIGIEGTRFDDVINVSEIVADQPNGTLKDSYRTIYSDGEGDDLYLGDDFGSSVKAGAGNDIIAAAGNLVLGDHQWFGRDNVSYQGKVSRYIIEEVVAGDQVLDSDGNLLFDLADLLANGNVTIADGTVQQVGNYAGGFVVRDQMPDQFSGNGIDLLLGVEEVNFEGTSINLNVSTYENSWADDTHADYQLEIHMQGTAYDDVIVAETDDVETHNVRNWVDSFEGNDFILTGGGGDEIRPGKGIDFIDGGASGTGDDSWQRMDKLRIEADSSTFIYSELSEAEVSAFMSEHFTAQNYTYNVAQKYYLISDTSVIDSWGKKLITNIDRLEFSDRAIELQASTSGGYDSTNNNAWFQVTGTDFADVVDNSTLVQELLPDDAPALSSLDYNLNFELAGGDDIAIGGEERDNFVDGKGNDIYIGYRAGEDGSGLDQVSYHNQLARYDIQKLAAGDMIYAVYGDANSNLLYDLSQLTAGIVTTGDGRTVDLGADADTIYVVRDLISDEQGGSGVDLLVNIDKIDVPSDQMFLNTQINDQQRDINGDITNIAKVTGTPFDDYFDFRAGVVIEGGSLVHSGKVEGGVGNDFVIGFTEDTSFTGGQGDDIFWDPNHTPAAQWWQENQAQYTGPADRYNVTSGFVAVENNELQVDQAGSVIWYDTFGGDNYQSAIKVEDMLANEFGGDGTDILVGIDFLSFADNGGYSVAHRESVDAWDYWGTTVDDQQVQIPNGKLVRKVEGSNFDEVLFGQNAPSMNELPEGWKKLTFSVDAVADAAVMGQMLVENPALFQYLNSGVVPQEYKHVADLPSDTGYVFELFVESATDYTYLQNLFEENQTITNLVDNTGMYNIVSGMLYGKLIAQHETDTDIDGAFILQSFLDTGISWFIDTGFNDLSGNGGDDTLIGGAGEDRFTGESGNDVYIGGDHAHDVDRAKYSGSTEDYIIEPIWVVLNNNQVVAEATSQLTESHQKAFVVTSLDTSMGSEGRDILIGVEVVEFVGSGDRLTLEPSIKVDSSNYYPGVNINDASISESGFPSFWIETSDLDEEIDLANLIANYDVGSVVVPTNNMLPQDLTYEAFRNTVASSGNDVYYGLANNSQWSYTSTADDMFRIKGLMLQDLAFTQGTDASNKDFVEITTKASYTGNMDIGINRLYDFEQVEVDQPGAGDNIKLPLMVNPSLEWYTYENGTDFASIEDSLFNDVIDDALLASYENADINLDNVVVSLRGGDDVVELSGSDKQVMVVSEYPTNWDINNGNDFAATGSLADEYRVNNVKVNEFNATYFLDANGNRQLDDGEIIDLDTFQTQGVAGIYDNSGTAITLEQYAGDYGVNAWHNDAVGLTNAGAWFDYNENYYVQIAHLNNSPVTGKGVDVLHDVEVFSTRLKNDIQNDKYSLDLLLGDVYLFDEIAQTETTYNVASDLSRLRDYTTPVNIAESVSILDIVAIEDLDTYYRPDEMADTWCIRLNYQDADNHSQTILGTDGVVTFDVGGRLYEAAGVALETLYAEYPNLADLSAAVTAYQAGESFTALVKDEVTLGRGNDIIDLAAEGAQEQLGGGYVQDRINLPKSLANYDISFGELDGNGRILNAELDFLEFIGNPGDKYLRIEDKLAPDLGGSGLKYVFDAEWVTPDGKDWLAGDMATYYSDNGSGVTAFMEGTPNSEVFSAATDSLVQAGVDGGFISRLEVKPYGGNDVIIGREHDELINSEDIDSADFVRIHADSSRFNLEAVTVGLATDRSDTARDANGDVLLFTEGDSVANGYTLTSAYRLTDSQETTDGGYGTNILVDIESVRFDGEGDQSNWRLQLELKSDTRSDGRLQVQVSDNGGVEIDHTFTLTPDLLASFRSQGIQVLGVDDRAGNDVYVIPTKEFNFWANIREGNDFVYISDALGSASGSANDVEYSDMHSSQFEVAQVGVKLDTDGVAFKNTDGSWQHWAQGTLDTIDAIMVTHVDVGKVDYGTDILIGVEKIRFSDNDYQTGIRTNSWENDGYGVTTTTVRQEGTVFDDYITIKLNTDDTPMEVRNELNGGAGDDILIGGAEGDYFNPGTGDDLIVGGANGSSGNAWQDQDQVAYDIPSFNRLDISKVMVGFDANTNDILRHAANGNLILNPTEVQLGSEFKLTTAYQVEDIVLDSMGGLGTDILIGIESLDGYGNNYQLGLREETRDWDDDGVIDWVNISGSAFADVIAPVSEGGDVQNEALIALSTEINTYAGDDTIYAGEGGDRIRPGAGNDFVDGGLNTGFNSWGGSLQDQVQFSNDLGSYDITVVDFANEAHVIYDLAGKLAFTVAKNGNVYGTDSTLLYTLVNDERYTVVTDNTPIGGEGTNFIIGVEEFNFGTENLRISVNTNLHYEDGELHSAWHDGTILDDNIMGYAVEDSMQGGKGNDTLVGLGGGDRLTGGQGNDVLIGGANGSTGNDWQDLDRADYSGYKSERAEISKVQVGINVEGTGLLMDADGEVIIDPTTQQLGTNYNLIAAHQITDVSAASANNFGTDVLVGMERLQFSDLTTDLLVNERVQDWNNDGVIDQVEVNGTIFGDLVDLVENGGTISSINNLNARNYIRTGDGDDTIFAYAGGDDISAGKGNDFIDGGNNGSSQNGWVRKDTARYDGDQARYEITTIEFNGEQDILIQDSFKILGADGSVIRTNNPNTVIATLDVGTKLIVVTDLLPDAVGGSGVDLLIHVESLDFKDGRVTLAVEQNFNYDSEGNILGSWSHGTMMDDTLTGTIVDDWMQGNAGDDTVIGGNGADSFSGGAGNDTIWGDDENTDQTLAGNDNARYSGFEARYVITKEQHDVSGEIVQAIIVQDILTDALGGEGRDVLYGVESLSFSDNWVRIGVETWEHKDVDGNLMSTYYQGSKFTDVIKGSDLVDQLNGNEGNDILYGFAGADQFEVGDGNDTVYGGTEGVDAWGNAGVDTVRFANNWDTYNVVHYDTNGLLSIGYDAAGYIEITQKSNDDSGDVNTLHGIERIEFSDRSMSFQSAYSFNDADGDGTPDWIQTNGTDGIDTITGKDIDDVIYAGNGDDVITGNEGNDMISGEGGSDSIDGDGISGSDADVFGIAYVDVAKYNGLRANFTIAASTGDTWSVTDNLTSDVDTLSNIEQVVFTDATLSLVTSMMSRDFNHDGTIDLYQVSGTLGADTFDINSESFTTDWGIAEASANIYIDMGEGDDSVTLGAGDDTVVAGLGLDTYDGATGLDTLRISGNFADAALVDLGNATFTVGAGANLQTFQNFEQAQFDDRLITLVATQQTIDVNNDGLPDKGVYTGTEFDNTYEVITAEQTLDWQLIGNGGSDDLTAGSGDDLLIGGEGTNTLNGGTGHDTAGYAGKASDYTIVRDLSGNFTVTETGILTDTLISIETLAFKDGLVSLEVSETVLSSFSLAVGVKETRFVDGTTYADSLSSSNNDDVLTGNAGEDVFTIVEAAMGVVEIVDFSHLEDTLQFDAGVDGLLNNLDVSTWVTATDTDTDTDTDKGDILTNLLGMATQQDDGLQFKFENGDQLFLAEIQMADLTITNIDII
jgi:Ca2+-binding RTX toxin-like protein